MSELTPSQVTIIVAIVGVVGTCISSYIGAWFSNHKSLALMSYKIDQLEIKVDKHNQLVERTYALEGKVMANQQEIEDIKAGKYKIN